MKVSIVIPVYNGEKTIARCLDSITRQRGVDQEVIVIDGDSTDGTLRILDRYKDSIAYLESSPDDGQSHAINKGLRAATGDILCWLCCDDTFADRALPKVVQAFQSRRDVDVVSGACMRVFENGQEMLRQVGPKSWQRVPYNNEFDQPAMFWSRRLYERVGDVDESLKLAMDWDYWNRFKREMRDCALLESVLAYYYFSETNKTSMNPDGHLKETQKVVAKYCPFGGLTEKLYSYLYNNFDLKGFYDKEYQLSESDKNLFYQYLRFAKSLFGNDIVDMYNWNWISKMERAKA